jgi:predicted DNA-binding transcriptional regulator AlpA
MSKIASQPKKRRRSIAHAELIQGVGDAVAHVPQSVGDPAVNGARGPPPIELWDVNETCAFFGGNVPINISTLYRGIASKRYPKPINISNNIVRWIAGECREALAQIVARRDAGERTTPRPGAGRRAA